MASLDRLSACLSRLPGIGRRSAERIAMRLVAGSDGLLRELSDALVDAERSTCVCSRCASITAADADPCKLCTSPSRDGATVCVVEDATDILAIERSGGFNGRYHALLGRISPMTGEGPGDIRIRALLQRVRTEKFSEVVLALSTDVEGDSTASYLAEVLKETGVRVSRLAFGLPAGSGVQYSDPVTLARAMGGRREA